MTKSNRDNEQHLLVFGLGYAASAIVQEVGHRFAKVTTTNRAPRQALDENTQALVFDGETLSDELAVAISAATHILVSIGPGPDGDRVYDLAKTILSKSDNLAWLGYLSTVGVYGNHDGAWVDETTPCLPVSARSIERVAAEKSWMGLSAKLGLPLTIFRLSGIYGPGRNALVNVEKGRSRRLVKKGQVFNRIHRDDIARAMDAAIASNANGIFNITDDEPAPPQDVVTYVHQLRGSEPPAELDFDTAELTPMARSFYGENKRVSNAKSKAKLGMVYRWPNYRASFDAMWKNDNWH